jgi:hypothetical protein
MKLYVCVQVYVLLETHISDGVARELRERISAQNLALVYRYVLKELAHICTQVLGLDKGRIFQRRSSSKQVVRISVLVLRREFLDNQIA